MGIKKGNKVSIHYTLKNDDGEVLDSSEGREALEYIAGSGDIIPGLDDALLGKVTGNHVDVTIAPEDAYGNRLEEAVQKVPKEQLANIPELQVGMPLSAETPQGTVTVFITEIGDEMITIDGNHPLAGQTLHFSVDVIDVAEGEEDSGPKIVLPH